MLDRLETERSCGVKVAFWEAVGEREAQRDLLVSALLRAISAQSEFDADQHNADQLKRTLWRLMLSWQVLFDQECSAGLADQNLASSLGAALNDCDWETSILAVRW